MARPRRAADDNPLVAIIMLVVLGGVAVVGIWNSLREKPRVAGNSAAATGEAQPGSKPGPSGSQTGFVDAFKRLPQDALALQRAYDAAFDDAARWLGDDELAVVKKITSRNAQSRDAFTDHELNTLRRNGFGNWVDAQAIRWSQEDPAFKTVSAAVWGRSPRARNDGGLKGLAVKWGGKDRSARLALLGLFQAVEGKSRDLSDGERATLAAFAGEEYVANRP